MIQYDCVENKQTINITPFLFYKNSFYKNPEAGNSPKIKNFVRTTPGSKSWDL